MESLSEFCAKLTLIGSALWNLGSLLHKWHKSKCEHLQSWSKIAEIGDALSSPNLSPSCATAWLSMRPLFQFGSMQNGVVLYISS
jgi:hypothetical protein